MTERHNERLIQLNRLLELAKREASMTGHRGGTDAQAIREYYIKTWTDEFNRIIRNGGTACPK